MATPQLRNSYDAALFAYAVLKYLGAGKVDSFQERLRSQKVQYLAQSSQVSPPYRFNLYIRGPYSPDLAHDLYEIDKHKIEATLGKVIPDELQDRLNGLKEFLKGKGIRELELVATLDWLITRGSFSVKQALSKLVRLKEASEEECHAALSQSKRLHAF